MRNQTLQATLFVLLLGILAIVGFGCSGATVTEDYKQTPARMESVGQGYYEYYVWEDQAGCLHLVPLQIPYPEMQPPPNVTMQDGQTPQPKKGGK
jgi:hypothetical protein